MEAKRKVLEWIDKRFIVSHVKLEDFKLFPGGTLLTDRNGEQMLVFYDILNECVLYSFPGSKEIKRG